MSEAKYHVAPQYLQGDETVLWASYGLEPTTPKKPRRTYKYIKIFGILAALCFAVFNAYSASKMSTSFLENLSGPKALPPMIYFAGGTFLILLVFAFGDKKFGLGEKAKKFAADMPGDYSAAMITERRLVLFGRGSVEDYDLRAGDIKAASYDFSNGGRVIKLELSSDFHVREVNIASTRDLTIAKQLIEDRFIKGGKMFRAQEVLT